VDEKRGRELPLPVFATSLGRDAESVDVAVCDVDNPELAMVFSPTFIVVPVDGRLARKVLLTETALKVAGFLTVEDVLICPFSPSLLFDLDASVSDPPLTLTSAELIWSSTLLMSLFSISSALGLPFKLARSESTSWRLRAGLLT
jgi:hypothetical protein